MNNSIKIYDDKIETSSDINTSDSSEEKSISDNIINIDLENIELKKSNNIFLENKNNINNYENNKLDSITLDSDEINFKDTEFYDYDMLKDISKDSFSKIYNILVKTSLIIFIDNFKLVSGKKINCFNYNFSKKCFLKKNITDEKFPGCIFLSFEFKKILLEYLTKLNKKVLKSELGKKEFIDSDKENYYCICFDEGEIYKNCVYKKLEIKNKILFIPINKYKLKITEYKIRGFCQIMEELGAKEINITFTNTVNNKNNSNLDFNTNIGTLAGNLGFSANNENLNKENRKYKLNYSNYHIVTLNENIIRKKIKDKKFIISENNYNSNLELQYVISSRCRYFITNYSTSFTLDTSLSIDKNLSSKFKKYNIGTESNLNFKFSKKNHISIITEVSFLEDEKLKDNLFGSHVSLDNIGFNYLIKSLTKENFTKKGIFKIMEFIDSYCKIKLKNSKKYSIINKILEKIKKNITINEYSEILQNYFDINSEWIHFKNFINLLSMNSTSYDKLGYLIIIENKNITKNEKISKIINFLHFNCCKNKDLDPFYEKKFWKMLRPLNKKLNYFFINKIDNQYNFLDTYNWYSINKILDDISEYQIINKKDNKVEIFNKLLKNLSLGYTYLEFYEKIIPFIENIFEDIYSKELEDNNENIENLKISLINIINYESFSKNNINTYEKLTTFIKNKLNKIKLGYKLVNELNNIEKKDYENKILDFICSKKFKKEYKYIEKKLRIIFQIDLENNKIKTKFNEYYNCNKKITTSLQSRNNYFVDRILNYNEKLDIKKIPSNYFGFYLMNNKYCNGYSENEIKNTIIPFLKKIIFRFADEIYKSDSLYYNKIVKINDNLEILNDNNIKYLSSYHKFINYISKLIEKKTSIIINNKILKKVILS